MKSSITGVGLTLAVLCLRTLVSAEGSEGSNPWETDFLLPDDTVPSHYDLYLYPNLVTGNVSGSVTIYINVLQQKSCLWLHAVKLSITETLLVTECCGDSVKIDNTFFFEKYSFFVIALKTPISAGPYKLQFKFNGVLSTEGDGLFIYTGVDPKRNFLGTYFEPQTARKAFPCFDQPDKKSTFTIQGVRPSQHYRALSNMNPVSEKENSPSSGLTTVLFDKTPPMPTYALVLFIVDYETLPIKYTDDKIPVTMYGDSSYLNEFVYALNITVSALNFYSKYFDVPYALPKLDSISLARSDFAGFEGWGLPWYNKRDISYKYGVTTTYVQYNLLELVNHEIVHMWCGNLVTPDWFNNLFVSEGLAYYIQFAGINYEYPTWQIYNYLPQYTFAPAMVLDLPLTAMTIVLLNKSRDDGELIDSEIMYNKFPCVLYMLEAVLGKEPFRLGVSSFLKAYSFKNAATRDIWKHMEKFSNGVDVTRFMVSFTEKNGYPVVTVNQSGSTLTLTQSRFRYKSDPVYTCKGNENAGCAWEIPVTLVGANKYAAATPFWFHMDQPTLAITLPKTLLWYKLNRDQTGYYLVLYPDEHWKKLADVLNHNHTDMNAPDRANLIFDAFQLADKGYIQFETAFNLTNYMDKEDYFPSWQFFYDNMYRYNSILAHSSAHTYYRRFIQNKVGPQLQDSTFKYDPEGTFFDRTKNRLLVYFGCDNGEKFCLKKAKELFRNWLLNSSPFVNEEIEWVVFPAAMSQCGEDEWDAVWLRYLEVEDDGQKDFLFQILCKSYDPYILERFIEIAKREDLVSASRYQMLLTNIASNPVGVPIIWDYIRNNLEFVMKRGEMTGTDLYEAISRIIAKFNTEIKLKELNDFLKTIPDSDMGEEQSNWLLHSVKTNIDSLKQYEDRFNKWFSDATQNTLV